MRTVTTVLSRLLMMLAAGAMVIGCVSNGDPKVPEPGSEKWYVQRIQEIEAAKEAGQLTEEQYLSLKNQADATRAARINASRYDNTWVPYGFGPMHDYSYH